MIRRSATPAVLLAGLVFAAASAQRPNLVITQEDVRVMRGAAGRYPVFDRSFAEARALIDSALRRPLSVPQPADAGGPTHERHKKNYVEMQLAGVLFTVTGEEGYARFVRDMLLLYARLYPELKTHPMALSEGSSGRLFWQTLNESVWLAHVGQAYDCVYDWIPPDERRVIEQRLLRPMARFLTVDRRADLDRIHNHGTWMAAAIGMLGYALRDRDLVAQALYGSDRQGKSGYFRQLDQLFSPDGYYAEGPYYARYALMPFYLLALAVEHNQPELNVFSYRDGILEKALGATLQLTNTNGEFFPLNDAVKGMSAAGKELVLALDVVYGEYGEKSDLLPVAAAQGKVMLSRGGVAVARGLATCSYPTVFPYRSVELRDGPDGDRGAVGILRGEVGTALVMKYGSQGMGHGHFDRLTFLYYEWGREVVQDYGSARWINIEPKFGGRYLKENDTWAKQTIAHNTLVVDGRSQFDGNAGEGERHPGERRFFKAGDSSYQVMSASAEIAPGVLVDRTMALVGHVPSCLVLDLVRVRSAESHRYDLPFYYLGPMIATNARYTAYDRERKALGREHGYEHLWLEAEGKAREGFQFTWLNADRYYTLTSAVDSQTSILFTRIGAGDPDFNLRNEPAVVLRRSGSAEVFASVIESHGYFDPVEEISTDARPHVRSVRILAATAGGTVVEIRGKDSPVWLWKVAAVPGSESDHHAVQTPEGVHTWTGNSVFERRP